MVGFRGLGLGFRVQGSALGTFYIFSIRLKRMIFRKISQRVLAGLLVERPFEGFSGNRLGSYFSGLEMGSGFRVSGPMQRP